jgi:hypothetical protein
VLEDWLLDLVVHVLFALDSTIVIVSKTFCFSFVLENTSYLLQNDVSASSKHCQQTESLAWEPLHFRLETSDTQP